MGIFDKIFPEVALAKGVAGAAKGEGAAPQTFAEKHAGKCLECKGSGECHWCGATGEYNGNACPFCKGTAKCKECKGTGKPGGGGFLSGLGGGKKQGAAGGAAPAKAAGGGFLSSIFKGGGSKAAGGVKLPSGLGSKLVKLIAVLALVAGIGFWLLMNPIGSQVSASLVKAMVGVSQIGQSTQGTVNVIDQVMKGTYDANSIYNSETVQEQYANSPQDVGVTISDVNPLQDEFTQNETLVVQGKLNVVSLSSSGVTAELTTTSAGWTCSPSQLKKVREVRNKQFTCEHPAVTDVTPDEVRAVPLDITAEARGTEAVTGKQFVVADPNKLRNIEGDPLDALQISKDAVQGWQKGDTSVELGIGVRSGEDVLEAYDPTAEIKSSYFLGVSINNPAFHTGTASITSIELLIPAPHPVTIMDMRDFDCTDISSSEATAISGGQALQRCMGINKAKLEPGESKTYYMRIQVPKSELGKQDFTSFFVQAKLGYDYSNMVSTVVNVRGI
ncbi:MAG: hypothetical protein V1839_04250 [archaeon]